MENNEKDIRKPVAGFDTHPENINRNGRPLKGFSITEAVKNMLHEKPEARKAIASRILKAALEGDLTATKLIWNYMDGMPLQKTDLTSAGQTIPLLGTTFDVPSDDSVEENQESTEAD